MEIHAIKALETNYIWTLIHKDRATVIDPGEAKPIIQYLKKQNITCSNIIITHHHLDHTGGVKELQEYYPQVDTYGPNLNALNIKHQNIASEKSLCLPDFDHAWKIIATPGHTLDHLCYHHGHHLFCGDTLFSIGCGRLFEGTYEQMFTSLAKIRSLPDCTIVYPAHEYTLSNIEFALSIEPDNQQLQDYHKSVQHKIDHEQPSIPTTLKIEKAINPFLRCHDLKMQAHLERKIQKKLNSPLEIFTTLRALKDHF
ncbi:MAG: hydroxyacylglutathione hydrolase [Pseudomonadota bacterium]|nr:hydroxyacylglutathione hydrolase [Pseudomonadota bacterium]